MGKRRILAVSLLAAVMMLMAAMESFGQAWPQGGEFAVFTNGGGRGGMDATSDTQSIDSRGIWSDPAPPPEFIFTFCEAIDLDGAGPTSIYKDRMSNRLDAIGVKDTFTYDDPQVVLRAYTETWVRQPFYLRYVWRGPDGHVINNMTELFSPHPHAIVPLWDYWEWLALWQYQFPANPEKPMAPGTWAVDVFFRWGDQSKDMEKLIATQTFMLKDVHTGAQRPAASIEGGEWHAPKADIVTLCKGGPDLFDVGFGELNPIDLIHYGDIIRGDQTVWAYVRFVHGDVLIDQSFHVVFDFVYEDPRVKFDFPEMDPYVYDIPHARTSFPTWEFWWNYVTAINFNPAELGMCAGVWKILVYAYPHSGDASMKVPVGTIAFVVEGGVPEPPDMDIPADKLYVAPTPNPFSGTVRFVAVAPGVLVDSLEVEVYDLARNLVFSGIGIDVVEWDGTSLSGVGLIDGAYIYKYEVAAGDTKKTGYGHVYISR